MTQAAWITFLIFGLAALILSRNLRTSYFSTIIGSMLIIAQFVLTEQVIAGIPIRIVVFSASVLALCFSMGPGRSVVAVTAQEKRVAGGWLLFILCAFTSSVVNRSFGETGDLVDFVSRYGYALVLFCHLSIICREPGGASFILKLMFTIAVANFIFVILQLSGVRWALDFQGDLFPLTELREQAMIAEGLISSFGYSPGLSSYSIATGYVLTCFSVAGLGLGLARNNGTGRWALVFTSLGATILGGIGILSRSTILVGGVVSLVSLFWLIDFTTKFKLAIFAIVGICVIAISSSHIYESAMSSTPGIHRLETLADSKRTELLSKALQFSADHPIFGGSPRERDAYGIGISAHNMVMNCLLYFGLCGLVPMLWLIYVSLMAGLDSVRSCRRNKMLLPLCTAGFASMIGYLLKSLFHNESIVTSGIMYAVSTAVTLGAGNAARASFLGSPVVAWRKFPPRPT